MLEEVELTEEGAKKFWLITLSYNPHMMPGGAPVVVFGQSSAKEYKQFKVDADDGNVLSMKIRTIR